MKDDSWGQHRARLELSSSEMRSLGYQVVDMLVEHMSTLPDQPVSKVASRAQLEQVIHEPIPSVGVDPSELLAFVKDEVLAYSMATNHPRFFAFVPGPSNFVSVIADMLISGYNPILAEWAEASGPATLELTTINWLRELCGLPSSAGGVFVSGGSAANLTALAVAREIRLNNDIRDTQIYCSEQTHGSNRKALKALGFSANQLTAVKVDALWQMDCDDLLQRIRADRASGKTPFCVIGNAGTTSSGAVDPIERLNEIGRSENIWIHIDGAYGAAAVITERGAQALRGLGDVDSLAIDPHKWLFQPFEIGCVLVKDFGHLLKTFGQDHVYLKDVTGDPASGEINLCDAGLQLTRSFRALKLWLSLKTFGLDAFREAIDYTLDLAVIAERHLLNIKDIEICTPARLGIVTFRYAPKGWSEEAIDAFNLRIVQWVIQDGRAMFSSTRLGDRTVLRLCTINPRTSEDDMVLTMSALTDGIDQLRNQPER